MTIWVDAQLPPRIAAWIAGEFGVDARPVRDLMLRDAEDVDIFERARQAEAVVMTKDSDFVDPLHRLGPPPQVIWLTAATLRTHDSGRYSPRPSWMPLLCLRQ